MSVCDSCHPDVFFLVNLVVQMLAKKVDTLTKAMEVEARKMRREVAAMEKEVAAMRVDKEHDNRAKRFGNAKSSVNSAQVLSGRYLILGQTSCTIYPMHSYDTHFFLIGRENNNDVDLF